LASRDVFIEIFWPKHICSFVCMNGHCLRLVMKKKKKSFPSICWGVWSFKNTNIFLRKNLNILHEHKLWTQPHMKTKQYCQINTDYYWQTFLLAFAGSLKSNMESIHSMLAWFISFLLLNFIANINLAACLGMST
jgi:hypothetical protein